MHRTNPISLLVYNALFPSPAPTDPPSFSAHLSKNLVGEVRIETATFYGSLDTIEARYPGLNYAHGPHRKRLGRFPHHRRLFEAFDRLGLTDSEIQGFCRWEGTLWARERYERDEGVKVEDTTGVEITAWVDRRRLPRKRGKINVKTDIEVEIEELPAGAQHAADAIRPTDTEMADEEEEPAFDGTSVHGGSEAEMEVDESVGFELNQRLMHAAALREQGNNVPMDPLWEQYLKDAQERGELGTVPPEAVRALSSIMADVATTSAVAGAAASTTPAAQPESRMPPTAPA